MVESGDINKNLKKSIENSKQEVFNALNSSSSSFASSSSCSPFEVSVGCSLRDFATENVDRSF